MGTFIAVATFSPETDLPQMNNVIAEEVAQVRKLTEEGRLGAVHISPARGRVFLEVRAGNETDARATVELLPMATWWAIDVFPTVGPPDQRD
jgi:muconolactone delta-isomerase